MPHSGPGAPHDPIRTARASRGTWRHCSFRSAARGLVPLEDADSWAGLEANHLKKSPFPVAAEVGNSAQALAAEHAGAAVSIARGNEGPGWVSQTGGLVLLQELLNVSELPVFLQGGVGLRTAAGAIAAGAVGVVLDVHLIFAAESGIPASLSTFLKSLTLPATITLELGLPMPLRIYSRIGTKVVRELGKQAEKLTSDEVPRIPGSGSQQP